MKSKRLPLILFAVSILLLIPFIAMQFTEEVQWTLSDFIVAGGLLLGTGLLFELAIRAIRNVRYRILVCSTLLVALLLVWAELALGIFGTPLAGS